MSDRLPRQELLCTPSTWRRTLAAWLLACLGMIMLAVVQYWEMGRSSAERLLTELAQPIGLFWFVLLVVTIRAGIGSWLASRGRIARGSSRFRWWLIAFACFTLVGNRWLSEQVLRATEHPTATGELSQALTDDTGTSDAGNFDAGNFDAVVMLGGGISADLRDQPQLGRDGDRIRPVLQLWNSGRTKRVIVTGTAVAAGRPGPAELTEKLLVSFGVPAEVIIKLQGQNTTLEMQSLRELFDRWDIESPRIALVTSAFHLPRALRLANAQGLSLVPISAASRLGNEPLGWGRCSIPTVGAIENISLCWKEWMAAGLGR